ncbi:hypothetical protein D3C87_2044440 [compost metagenome]
MMNVVQDNKDDAVLVGVVEQSVPAEFVEDDTNVASVVDVLEVVLEIKRSKRPKILLVVAKRNSVVGSGVGLDDKGGGGWEQNSLKKK